MTLEGEVSEAGYQVLERFKRYRANVNYLVAPVQ